MDKRKRNIIGIIILVLLILSLVIYNVVDSKGLDYYHKEKVLTVNRNHNRIDEINYGDIQAMDVEEFEIDYRRKVGNPVLKKYAGVQIKEIFKELNINITDMIEVEVTAVDNFVVTIFPDEILKEENVYVVFNEDGKELEDDFGPYMIVIRDDDIATRWNRRIVNINIKSEK